MRAVKGDGDVDEAKVASISLLVDLVIVWLMIDKEGSPSMGLTLRRFQSRVGWGCVGFVLLLCSSCHVRFSLLENHHGGMTDCCYRALEDELALPLFKRNIVLRFGNLALMISL